MADVTIRIRTTAATVLSAEGARVGIVSCLECGAALLLDPRDGDFDPVVRHIQWHDAHREAADAANGEEEPLPSAGEVERGRTRPGEGRGNTP